MDAVQFCELCGSNHLEGRHDPARLCERANAAHARIDRALGEESERGNQDEPEIEEPPPAQDEAYLNALALDNIARAFNAPRNQIDCVPDLFDEIRTILRSTGREV